MDMQHPSLEGADRFHGLIFHLIDVFGEFQADLFRHYAMSEAAIERVHQGKCCLSVLHAENLSRGVA